MPYDESLQTLNDTCTVYPRKNVWFMQTLIIPLNIFSVLSYEFHQYMHFMCKLTVICCANKNFMHYSPEA